MWREVVELGRIVDRLGEVAGSRVVADAAVIFSWEAWWATDTECRPSQAVGYLTQVHATYAALHARGLTVDVVRPGADLSAYRLVVVPGLHLLRADEAAVLTDWIAAGGTAVVTFNSGIVDEQDRIWAGGYTGPLREALGIHVEEFAPVAPGVAIALDDGTSSRLWSERLRTTTAETLARFADGPAAGSPAVTRNAHGRGSAWYLATQLDPAALADRLGAIARDAGVRPPAEVDAAGAFEIVRRRGERASYVFVVNHGDTDLVADVRGTELITGTAVEDRLRVPSGAVRVVREENPS